jgi:hypothetical protein
MLLGAVNCANGCQVQTVEAVTLALITSAPEQRVLRALPTSTANSGPRRNNTCAVCKPPQPRNVGHARSSGDTIGDGAASPAGANTPRWEISPNLRAVDEMAIGVADGSLFSGCALH